MRKPGWSMPGAAVVAVFVDLTLQRANLVSGY